MSQKKAIIVDDYGLIKKAPKRAAADDRRSKLTTVKSQIIKCPAIKTKTMTMAESTAKLKRIALCRGASTSTRNTNNTSYTLKLKLPRQPQSRYRKPNHCQIPNPWKTERKDPEEINWKNSRRASATSDPELNDFTNKVKIHRELIKLNRQNEHLRNMSCEQNIKDIVRGHLEAVENTLGITSEYSRGPETERGKVSRMSETKLMDRESFTVFEQLHRYLSDKQEQKENLKHKQQENTYFENGINNFSDVNLPLLSNAGLFTTSRGVRESHPCQRGEEYKKQLAFKKTDDFAFQLQKLKQNTAKNQQSLSQYLKFRKHLLEIKDRQQQQKRKQRHTRR